MNTAVSASKKMRKSKVTGVIIPLTLLLVVIVLVACSVGSVSIPPKETLLILLDRLPFIDVDLSLYLNSDMHTTIIWQIRLPRVVLGVIVGSALALAGAAFQGLFRNPMADPFIIGVSSGAALGAVLAMVLGLNFYLLGLSTVPILAFVFSLATVLIVYRLARVNGRVPVTGLLLAGIATSSFLTALVSMAIFIRPEKAGPILFWMMGGLAVTSWTRIMAILPYAVIGGMIVLFFARDLNIMLLGEDTAHQLGVEVETVKRVLLVSAALLTAGAVSVSGIIGFVGLITPHIVRLIIGPDHRLLLPASALSGGIVLLVADTVARTVLAPGEIPVGIVTALLGAPFFLYILYRSRSQIL